MRHALFHLIPLQLKEVVEIVGVQGRAQVRRSGSLAEAVIRVGRVGFGSECVKSAGLVGVLQGEVDPVEKLRRLVHGGTRVYGRQQAHLSIQMAKLDFPPLISWTALNFLPSCVSSPVSPADGKCSSVLPVQQGPVLLAPGASSQFDVTHKSLR